MSKVLLLSVYNDITIHRKKEDKSLPNTEDIHYELKAGVPHEVEDYIADIYVKYNPNGFKIVDSPEPVKAEEKKVEEKKVEPSFNAVEFLTNHPATTKSDLEELKREELIKVCEALELTPSGNNKTLISKIVQEIKIRNESEKEIEE